MKNKLKKIPKEPGVYRFYSKVALRQDSGAKKAEVREIIYIGKASNLKNRLSSYFIKKGRGQYKTEAMISEARDFDWRVTDSEIEAIILEALEIKKYLPRYNIKVKDAKSFLYLRINAKYPQRPELVRKSQAIGRYVFGPFVEAGSAREALKFIRKIFPFRDCSDLKYKRAVCMKKPCLQYFIKNCPGPCIGRISRRDYKKNIKNIILFFSGRKKRLVRSLHQEMKKRARACEFEQAAKLRDQIRALAHIEGTAAITQKERRDTALAELSKILGIKFSLDSRIEAYDISNIMGKEATASMAVFVGGIPDRGLYRKFKIKTIKEINDYTMFSEVFQRRFSGTHKDWPSPDLIIIDGGQGQLNTVNRVISGLGIRVPVLAIAKGVERKKVDLYFKPDSGQVRLSGGGARMIVYIPTKKLSPELLNLLTQIRDEAHRFAISYHRLLRRKKFVAKL